MAYLRKNHFASHGLTPSLPCTNTGTQYCPQIVKNLIWDLQETPESGRDALVNARLHELNGNRSDQAADLLRDIVTDELAGIRASTIAGLATTIHPTAILRCIMRLPKYTRAHQIRHICGTIGWRDALPLVALIRDEQTSLGPYAEFNDDTLTLGLLLASDTHLLYGHTSSDLHRASGAETLFLFGACRDPSELLREITKVHIITWLRHNYDTHLAVWAFNNPALVGEPRYYALMQNAPQVVASLRNDGILSSRDVVAWLRGGSARESFERIVTVLSLSDNLVGAVALKKATLFCCKDLSDVAIHLSKQSRKSTSYILSDDPSISEIIENLLPEWRSTSRALVEVAQALHGHYTPTKLNS